MWGPLRRDPTRHALLFHGTSVELIRNMREKRHQLKLLGASDNNQRMYRLLLAVPEWRQVATASGASSPLGWHGVSHARLTIVPIVGTDHLANGRSVHNRPIKRPLCRWVLRRILNRTGRALLNDGWAETQNHFGEIGPD